MNASPSSVIRAGNLTRQSLSGVWIKNVFWRWRIYCVLKVDNRLELYSNKRSFTSGHAPRNVIDLSTSICICPAEYIRPGAFIILTSAIHMCLSSVTVDDRDEWISAITTVAKAANASVNSAVSETQPSEPLATVAPDGALMRETPKGSSLCNRIWPVIVLPSNILTSSSFQFHGRYWLAANNSEICVLPYANPVDRLLHVSFSTIRCCGGVGKTTFFELGRQANTGEGRIWLEAISATAADDMKRFFSEFLSKRFDSLADGNKRTKKSDRLIDRAVKVKHNIPSFENNVASASTENVVEDPLVASPVSPDQHSALTGSASHSKITLPEDRSYLEMAPPKVLSSTEKKPSVEPNRTESTNGTIESEHVKDAKPVQTDKDDFLELDFGGNTALSPNSHPHNSNFDSPTVSIHQQRHVESTTPQSNQESITASNTPPSQVKQRSQQNQLQIADKGSNGGDYVVVCAPKAKQASVPVKTQESLVVSQSSTVDEEVAPFLADEFLADIQNALPVPDNSEGNSVRSASTSISTPATSFISPGPIQYVSLQIASDDPKLKNGLIDDKKATDKPEKESLHHNSVAPQAVSPQMSSVSVIYADLDFSPNSARPPHS